MPTGARRLGWAPERARSGALPTVAPCPLQSRARELAGGDIEKAPGDQALGPVDAAGEYAGCMVHCIGDQRAVGQLQVQRGAEQLPQHSEDIGCEWAELYYWQASMTFAQHSGMRITDAGAEPNHDGLVDAELHRNHIGGDETVKLAEDPKVD